MANEKRLIDANALWLVFSEEAKKIEIGVKDHRKLAVSKLLIHWCMEKVAKAPTVDAVPVIRCKDCKYWKDVVLKTTEHEKFCDIGFYKTKESGFCSFGERRSDDC